MSSLKKTSESTTKLLEQMRADDMKEMDLYDIKISVKYAQDLPQGDLFGKSDPYLKIFIGNVYCQTSRQDNTLNPVWNENMQFCVLNKPKGITIECYDYNNKIKDTFLGKAEVPLIEPDSSKFITLQDKNGKDTKGQVYMGISYKKLICLNETEVERRKQQEKELNKLKREIKKMEEESKKNDIKSINKSLKQTRIIKRENIYKIELNEIYTKYFALKGNTVDDESKNNNDIRGMYIDKITSDEYGKEITKIGVKIGAKLISINDMNLSDIPTSLIQLYLDDFIKKYQNKRYNIILQNP
mmetsp:Transcript_10166/g.12648  ORF Transcript_10166/g.12648 Transcript_10166/m.12648 type:complete len:299 (+) Transcript_10166:27-923(+)